MNSIILILKDQLSLNISSLKNCDKKNDIIFIPEIMEDFCKPKHHKKKIVFQLASMRNFASKLQNKGYNVHYLKIDDESNSQNLNSELIKFSKLNDVDNIKLTYPSEFHKLNQLSKLKNENLNLLYFEDTRFLCSIEEFKDYAESKKKLIMENFYRYMRIKHKILVNDKNKPIGEKWNFDKENRKPPKSGLKIPTNYQVKTDSLTNDIIILVDKLFNDHFGDIKPFYLATTSEDAEKILNDFLINRFENFGAYQDAMIENEDFMFHSHISFYLNNGLLDPLDTIKKAESFYFKKNINLNSVEGFIRQILGWREYVRGIYWLNMPNYKNLNFLNADNKLPNFFWEGNSKMKCIDEAVRNTKENAYAHHIQRLMVLGNYALITSINPEEVNEWYLVVYADAYEWVELPNVSGMILFADGGILGTKPYAASGSYINKMSNYCKNCSYKVSLKNGPNACPFNYLYWNFLIKNKDLLSKNQRMSMIYNVLAKFDKEKLDSIKSDSKKFLENIN